MPDDIFRPPDNDKTIVRPMPGGRRGKTGPEVNADTEHQNPFAESDFLQPGRPLSVAQQTDEAALITLGVDSGNIHPNAETNGFLASSSGLMLFAVKLRVTAANQDVNAIFHQCVDSVKAFELKLTNFGVPHQQVVSARYMLCSFVDEAILSTPWGSRSGWDRRTLTSTFHNEVHGGEKFFDIVDLLRKDPRQYVELLGFAHACLALGFKGRYRLINNGETNIRNLKEDLYQAILQTLGEQEYSLSRHLPDDDISNQGGKRRFPFWAVAVLTGSALVVAYTTFLFSVNKMSDPVANRLTAIGLEIPVLIKNPRVPTTLSMLSLSQYFPEEIEQDQLYIVEDAHKASIVLNGLGLFESGSAAVTEARKVLLAKLAGVILNISADILVVGHTDDVPIRSIAFPSNWQLSKARAASVAVLLEETLRKRRIEVEGLADRQPLVPNSNADNRAKNRRVEITLFKQ